MKIFDSPRQTCLNKSFVTRLRPLVEGLAAYSESILSHYLGSALRAYQDLSHWDWEASPGPPGCRAQPVSVHSRAFCSLASQSRQRGGEGGAEKCRSVSFTVCTVRTQAAACTYPSESPGTRLFTLDTLHTEAKKCFCFYLDTGPWQKSNIHVCIHSSISMVCLTYENNSFFCIVITKKYN